jgi:hypothetical protein
VRTGDFLTSRQPEKIQEKPDPARSSNAVNPKKIVIVKGARISLSGCPVPQ